MTDHDGAQAGARDQERTPTPASVLSERVVIDALIACLPTDDTGHVTACGYDEAADPSCGCYSPPGRLAEIVATHVAAALTEVERRIEESGVRTDSAERWGIITALRIVRAYRDEASR